MSEKRIESRRLEYLKSHPRQAELFSDLNEAEFESLKQSVSNGLNVPIEITNDNVVIDGHQRLRAARELGWNEIKVWVRDDLNQQAIDQRHIEANLDRRQLSRLEQARLIKALCDLERENRPLRRRYGDHLGDVRDRIGKRFGMDGRTAQRWMNLLETPREVQDAVSQGKLYMVLAEKVSRLTPELKQQVADRIRKGEDPNQAVKKLLTPQTKPEKRSAKECKVVDLLETIAVLLEQVAVNTNLSDEERKRSLDALTRCTNRCHLLTSQLKRPRTAAKADAGNCQSEYSNLGAL